MSETCANESIVTNSALNIVHMAMVHHVPVCLCALRAEVGHVEQVSEIVRCWFSGSQNLASEGSPIRVLELFLVLSFSVFSTCFFT